MNTEKRLEMPSDIIRDRDLGVYVHAAAEGGWWAYTITQVPCESEPCPVS